MVSSAVEEGLLEEKAVVDDALENQNLCPSCKRIQRLVSNEGKIFQRNEAEIGSTSAVSSGETVFVCFVRVKRNNWVRHRDDSINNRPGWSAKMHRRSINRHQTSASISACAAAFAFLWKKDEEAKEKQMSRIGREERLGGLKVELTTGKIVRMQSLRGFSRVVLFAESRILGKFVRSRRTV